jgi:hypothetical protein
MAKTSRASNRDAVAQRNISDVASVDHHEVRRRAVADMMEQQRINTMLVARIERGIESLKDADEQRAQVQHKLRRTEVRS